MCYRLYLDTLWLGGGGEGEGGGGKEREGEGGGGRGREGEGGRGRGREGEGGGGKEREGEGGGGRRKFSQCKGKGTCSFLLVICSICDHYTQSDYNSPLAIYNGIIIKSCTLSIHKYAY